MTEMQVYELGFQCKNQYVHDDFNTNRFVKGLIEVEFTYEGGVINSGGKLVSVDITMDEVIGKEVTLDQLKQLDNILNQ